MENGKKSGVNPKSEFKDSMAKLAVMEGRKAAVQEKELILKEHKVEADLANLEQNKQELEIQKKTDISPFSQVDMSDLVKDAYEYFSAAKNKMPFLVPEFDTVISFHRKSLITFLAPTGMGKSTLTANIVRHVISQVNPVTNHRRRVLVLTNEEAAFDVYGRVCCLINGWHYVSHSEFTQPQIEKLKNFMVNAKIHGVMQVIDDAFGGSKGATTTLEGIVNIFDRIVAEGIEYDAIIIDYYQNISGSKLDASLEPWKIQEKLMLALDQYKNRISAPIVLMAQVKKPEKNGDTYLEPRLTGSKQLITKSTDVLEIFPNFETYETEWLVHKSRFNGATGKRVRTGYDGGKIVSITKEFNKKREQWQYKKIASAIE